MMENNRPSCRKIVLASDLERQIRDDLETVRRSNPDIDPDLFNESDVEQQLHLLAMLKEKEWLII